MNRRDALKSLMSLPAVAHISVATLGPTDVIVIECPLKLSRAQEDGLATNLRQVWPDHKCVVLSDGMKLKIVAGTVPA